MSQKLKLITVNIEGDNHLDRVMKFLQDEQPDVVCMQEVFADDVPMFQEKLQMEGVFAPLARVERDAKVTRLLPRGGWGLCILSRFPLTNVQKEYYAGTKDHTPELFLDPNNVNRMLLSVTVVKGEQEFCIGTTHFTWTSGGQTTDLQREHVQKLLEIVAQKKDLILCGDFNAPRGNEIFDRIASRLKDNIPSDITTTLDQKLHKVSGLMFVIDGMFTTPEYTVSDVRVIEGVSDHMPVVGIVRKNNRDLC